MNLEIRECKHEELANVIDRLDSEFILSKQRSLSLSKRFPSTLSLENIKQIHVAVSDGVICGAYAIRIFDWAIKKQIWRGAMIGMVWVDSKDRGKGIGSNLLAYAKQFLHKRDVDFGVLWTGAPAFYERAGWLLNSCGLFGEAANCPPSPCIDAVSSRPLDSIDVTWIERLRSSIVPMRVARNALDYHTVPIPAVRVLCFCVQDNDSNEGCALVGEQDGTGYFYEMIAPSPLWNIIWSAVRDRFSQLFVNGHSDDSFAQWLAENRNVAWMPQNKSMWLRISDRIEGPVFNTWHIPYFDWI